MAITVASADPTYLPPIRISAVNATETTGPLTIAVLNPAGTSTHATFNMGGAVETKPGGVISVVMDGTTMTSGTPSEAWTALTYSPDDLVQVTYKGVVLSIERMEVVLAKQGLFGALVEPTEMDQSGNYTFGSVTAGTITANLAGNATNVTGVVAGANGGTGVANTDKTITIGGNFATSGAHATTLVQGATVSLILPLDDGTLATLAGTEALTGKTYNGLTITNNGTNTLNIATGKTLTTTNDATVSGTNTGDITTAGEDYLSLTNQVLTANEIDLTDNVTGILPAANGGTGINNGTNTIDIEGNITTAGAFTTTGAFSTTLNATALTSVTLPTTGTLATLAGDEDFINKKYDGLTLASLATGFTIEGGTTSATLTVNGTGSISGTNTGDNATNSLYSSLVSNATHTGDATGATALTVVAINGTPLSGLTTGILKNTTTTGVPTIAVAGTDYIAPYSATTAQNLFLASPDGSVGSPTFRAIAANDITATIVTGKVLTGFVKEAGVVAATDDILTAFEKLDGNLSAVTLQTAYANGLAATPATRTISTTGGPIIISQPTASNSAMNIVRDGTTPASTPVLFLTDDAEGIPASDGTLLQLVGTIETPSSVLTISSTNSGESASAVRIETSAPESYGLIVNSNPSVAANYSTILAWKADGAGAAIIAQGSGTGSVAFVNGSGTASGNPATNSYALEVTKGDTESAALFVSNESETVAALSTATAIKVGNGRVVLAAAEATTVTALKAMGNYSVINFKGPGGSVIPSADLPVGADGQIMYIINNTGGSINVCGRGLTPIQMCTVVFYGDTWYAQY